MTVNGRTRGKRVLAIDLGTHTGWALRTAEGLRFSGAVEFANLRGDGGGMRLLRLKHWLTETKGPEGLDLVVYELVQRHGPKQTYAAQLYGQFLGMVMAWCEHHKIPYAGVNVSTLKKHGTGKGSGKGADKTAMVAAAARLGVETKSDDEADAVVLLDYAERYLIEQQHEGDRTAAIQDAARPGRA